MNKVYCEYTDACMDGVYCKAGHGGSFGVCEHFPNQIKCKFYRTDKVEEETETKKEAEELTDAEVIDRWKPGSYAYCIFGNMVYRVTIKAIGFVKTERSTTYHVSYLVPVGSTYVRVNWLIGEKKNQLFDTRREAFMELGEETDD